MRRLNLLLAAFVVLPLCLHAAPAAAPAAAPSAASQKPRVIQQFIAGWRFLQADTMGAEQPSFDDSSWKPVTLPHDWAIAGPFTEDAPSRGAGAFTPTGIGWYRKTSRFPQQMQPECRAADIRRLRRRDGQQRRLSEWRAAGTQALRLCELRR